MVHAHVATGRFSGPGAVEAKDAKFAFWASMADLLALVMRSGAPQLRVRIAAALVLVFVGKLCGVLAPVMVVMVVRLDWRFALTAFATLVIYAAVTFKITDWRLSHRRELNDAENRAAGLSADALMNYETLKAFGAEDRLVDSYGRAMAQYVDASARPTVRSTC